MKDLQGRAPGWYPDDRYPGDERYWDGVFWGASRPAGYTETVDTSEHHGERSGGAMLVMLACLALIAVGVFMVMNGMGDSDEDQLTVTLHPLVGDGYVITDSLDGQPKGINPCQPVAVAWNTALAPEETEVLEDALAEFGRASGLSLVNIGDTDYIPGGVDGGGTPPGAGTLTIAVASRTGLTASSMLITSGRDTIGVGGYQPGSGRYAHESFVVVDVDALNGLTRTERRDLYLHELGHAAGLDHVDDPNQLMYPTLRPSAPSTYGPGDLAGLKRLGDRSACR